VGAADLAGEAERREEAAGLRRRASCFLERVAPGDQCIVVDLVDFSSDKLARPKIFPFLFLARLVVHGQKKNIEHWAYE
jgi:hypothetical protein